MLTQFQLKNKMRVLFVQSHKAPVVSVQMWVKTGSADEKKGEEGISHFIEHLVFKGTKNFGVGEIARTIEGSGGELNAYTTYDHTVFHVTMSRTDLNTGLRAISEMMGYPLFDPAEIDKEREVVIEEIKRSQDNPYQQAAQGLFSLAYSKHAYGTPIIGFDKVIKKVSPKVLTGYFKRRYVPSNMTLVVAGDFEKAETKNSVADIFGAFHPYKLEKVKRKQEPTQKSMRFKFIPVEFKEATINIGFKIPNVKHKDIPAIDVLSFILGQGDSSRLVKRLRLESSIVTGIGCGSYTPLDPGIFTIGAQFNPENFNDLKEALFDEIDRLLTVEPSLEELGRAKINLEADEIYNLETVDGLARKVGAFQLLLDDPEYIGTYLKAVQKLTPKDIVAIARKYFAPQKLNVVLASNKQQQKALGKAQLAAFSKEFTKLLNRCAKTKIEKAPGSGKTNGKKITVPLHLRGGESKIVKHRLPNGALVIFKRNDEVPSASFKVGFLGGLRQEPESRAGVTSVLSNTWTAGSREFTETEIAQKIESFAGSLTAFGGRNSIGLSLETLSAFEDESLRVFDDVLCHPIFPDEAVAREAGFQIEQIKTREDHPSGVAVQLFLDRMFKGHPYSKDILGNQSTLENIKSHDVHEYWKKMVNSDNAVFVGAGKFDEQKILKHFELLSNRLGRGEKFNKTFPVPDLKGHDKHFYELKKEQSHIIVGYRGLSFLDPERYALQLMQSILAGQGGRLFLELRDRASLAYSVGPIQMEGMETGYFGVYIGCSPEKGSKSLEMIDIEIEKLVSKAPSEGELTRAKKYLLGRHDIDLQRNGAQASAILFNEIYGLDAKEAFDFYNKIKDITPDDIKRLANRIFKANSIQVAVGPINPF